ncbi:polysaccharide pyruvyl transferase family protein [Litchfieldella anticariensis]|uniref:polysaccharide pyruvyl transferase family protein n=1 Tax=Litchfieldella anticariensis TaxID=258591 RepID=UPI0013785498|nr:polysaccharide pyruvyl transferase family protein [Halomonas anticariensis]
MNDNSDTRNWGAQATSMALCELVHSAGGNVERTLSASRLDEKQGKDYPAIAYLAGYFDRRLPAWSMPRRLNHAIFNRLARQLPDVVPDSWEDFDRQALRVLQHKTLGDIREALENSDLVVINGEGCIYGNIRHSRMLFFIAYLAKRYLGRETVMVNHSADLRHPTLNRIARHVYPLLDEVVFRETDSALACSGFCSSTIGADAAYLYTPAPVENWSLRMDGFDPGRPYVCVGGSSSYLRRGDEQVKPVAGYVELCRHLQAECDQVVLVAASWQDERIFQAVKNELGIPLIGVSSPFRQAIDVIGNARVYIGGRWHSAIFAHAGGTPVVALGAYTPKMQAFLHDSGQPGTPFDPFELATQAPKIAAGVRDCLEQGDRLRAVLSDGARECARRARLNVNCVEKMVVSRSTPGPEFS